MRTLQYTIPVKEKITPLKKVTVLSIIKTHRLLLYISFENLYVICDHFDIPSLNYSPKIFTLAV